MELWEKFEEKCTIIVTIFGKLLGGKFSIKNVILRFKAKGMENLFDDFVVQNYGFSDKCRTMGLNFEPKWHNFVQN